LIFFARVFATISFGAKPENVTNVSEYDQNPPPVLGAGPYKDPG
jgi:hypothetical protein